MKVCVDRNEVNTKKLLIISQNRRIYSKIGKFFDKNICAILVAMLYAMTLRACLESLDAR